MTIQPCFTLLKGAINLTAQHSVHRSHSDHKFNIFESLIIKSFSVSLNVSHHPQNVLKQPILVFYCCIITTPIIQCLLRPGIYLFMIMQFVAGLSDNGLLFFHVVSAEIIHASGS